MREVLCVFALFLTLPSFAVQSTFCLKVRNDKAEVACTVTQMLSMSDGRAFWTCEVGGEQSTLSTRSYLVGFSYDKGLAFSEHIFSEASAEGKLLLPHFNLPYIVDKHALRIYYAETAPYVTDSTVLLTDERGGFHKIDIISIYYGSCAKV